MTPAQDISTAAAGARPIKVGVLVDLIREEAAGGHVKCWERLAEAASAHADAVDLTVYFLGRQREVVPVLPNARHVILPPVFSSERLPFLRASADFTDLARHHPALAHELGSFDLLHATDIFCFARTALRHKLRVGTPLVSSIHTDVVRFTEIYTHDIIRTLVGDNVLARFLNEVVGVPQISAAGMARRLDRYLEGSDHVFVSSPADRERLILRRAPESVSYLRRGIDRERFHPRNADRAWLRARFGVPESPPLIMFAGRVDDSKGVMVMAAAARSAMAEGRSAHVVVCGEGARSDAVRAELGEAVSMLGTLGQEDLARVYASADLFVFPSRSDVSPNAVIEAKASGLAVLVARGDGGAQFVACNGEDGVVVDGQDAGAWAAHIAQLLDDASARTRMKQAARHWAETAWPSWAEVLGEDLVPVWRDVVARLRPSDLRAAA